MGKNVNMSNADTTVSKPVGSDDPFDPANFKVSQDYMATAGVKKATTVVRVTKPDKTWFVRVNPDPTYQMTAYLFELRDESETYLIRPDMLPEMGDMAIPKAIYTAKTRQGLVFLWPVKLPDADGKIDDWNKSAMEGASIARDSWVSIRSNRSAGFYDVLEAAVTLSEPDWSDLPPFRKLLEVAFTGKVIDSADHPVLKRLRGEV
jgi:hypothetical protein